MAGYQRLHQAGELRVRTQMARANLEPCSLCPHQCRVNRLSGKSGKFRVTDRVTARAMGRNTARAIISSYGPHFGEESPLVGRNGSATIFFTYCHLQCIFRQNYSIGQLGEGND